MLRQLATCAAGGMQLQRILSKHGNTTHATMGILTMLTSLHAKEGGWRLGRVSLQPKAVIERREYGRILRQGGSETYDTYVTACWVLLQHSMPQRRLACQQWGGCICNRWLPCPCLARSGQLLHVDNDHLKANLVALAHDGAKLEAATGALPLLGATAFLTAVCGAATGAASGFEKL